MNLALYRKYRPQSFKEVVGQNHIKTTLQSELETEKLAHAYLFSGPRGLGKTTTARLLAKAVNCTQKKSGESEPCNKCDACISIVNNKTLDVIEIDAASHTGVDNVRENIIENSRFTPSGLKFKVFIIDEVHMLSVSAFNALLKTLEEPPAHAMFILATTEIHKLPQTIISRCQHFDFRPVGDDELIKRLSFVASQEKKKIDSEVLGSIAYYSGGSIRDAESLLGQVLSLDEKNITAEQAELVLPKARFDLVLDLVEAINKRNTSKSLTIVNNLVQDGVDLEKFSDNLIEIFRKILLRKVSSDLDKFGIVIDRDFEKKLDLSSDQMSQRFVIQALEILVKKRQEIKFANIKQLPLELAVVEIIGSDSNDTGESQPIAEKKEEIKSKITEGQGSALPVQNKVAAKKRPEVVAEVEVQKNPVIKEEKTDHKARTGKIKTTLDQINQKWQDVLTSIKEHNHSLASTFNIGKPTTINDDGTLEVAFEHEFHQQRVNDVKNKEILERILNDIFGEALIIKTIIVKKPVEESEQKVDIAVQMEENSQVDDIASAFGGQVVD